VALIGAGAFLPAMVELDRELLDATGRPRPRVVILTLAQRRASDVMPGDMESGVDYFRTLGAEVEPIVIPEAAEDGDDAVIQAIGEADLICLADGRSGRLGAVLDRTRLGAALIQANQRGAVLIGCSAGAGALATRQLELRGRVLPWPARWQSGLGLLRDAVVLPGYDRLPEPIAAVLALQAPHGAVVLGIDALTAVVGREGAWQVHGAARVTVWRGRHRRRYRRGDVFRI
jgi:cyanophycinase-like exopeptidase